MSKSVGLIIGTGPALTDDVICTAAKARCFRFGVNNAWRVFDLDVFHACNPEYYHAYWDKGLSETRSEKWTWDEATADRYGINYVKGAWAPGLSVEVGTIAYHHGAGPQLVNIAYHYGIKIMLLIGWDMRYPGKVSNTEYTLPRHFFGEDTLTEKHYPSTGPKGELTGLIKEMETIKPEDYDIEIINCTPNSAMTCFPMMDLKEALVKYDVAAS